jgi:hypothetical protein
MMQRVSVASPRIVRQPNYVVRGAFALFAVVGLGILVGTAFFAGVKAERDATKELAERVRKKDQEGQALAGQVAELKEQSILLERSLQIDREANRTVSEQLKTVQDERLAAEKEVSFLRRLIQNGGGGILRPKDFKLKESPQDGQYRYSVTIQQLIQDFGESVGSVDIKVIGKRGGKEVTLPLSELEGSEPKKHKLKLKHFQIIEGMIRIPDDLDPENLVVEISPETPELIPVSETFSWYPE